MLVKKSEVNDLLLAQHKGELRLVLHRSSVPSPSFLGQSRLGSGAPNSYRPKNPVIVDRPVESVRRIRVADEFQTPAKTESQQLLDEVRAMRHIIQGLCEDMNRLRKTLDQSDSEPTKIDHSKLDAAGNKAISADWDAGDEGQATRKQTLVIHEDHMRMFRLAKKISRIAVGSAKIVDITQFDPYEFGVTGRSVGTTTITFWLAGEEEPRKMTVYVHDYDLPVGNARTAPDEYRLLDGAYGPNHPRMQQWQSLLNRSISLELRDATLKEALKTLQTVGNINLYVDEAALKQEGLTSDAKLTVQFKDVPLRTALRVVLETLKLGYLVEGEVLKITTKENMKGRQLLTVYKVTDLLSDPEKKSSYEELIELITTVIDSNSWAEKGGEGVIQTNQKTHSLVIRQSRDAHDQIQHLLSTIRKWRESFQAAKKLDAAGAGGSPLSPDSYGFGGSDPISN
ncbi:MAG: hypothetical protein CMJ78_25445 [Planctomycetaceae bacterium]|nr:hypothetical protein [Planctomycetaceae bacterium]